MDIGELITAMALLEERGELDKLGEIGLPPGNPIQWLFGLTSGFYFADGETRRTRQAMLDLALRYYDIHGMTSRIICHRMNILTRQRPRASISGTCVSWRCVRPIRFTTTSLSYFQASATAVVTGG
ncbi:hypothetical protein [Agrobacterium salinitolerans]|uniref:hypothetical protein n=1 Tax=Agrobacterium salinitolerans TaxID=1183413 RepID=UPI001FCE5047|nr:hypothetical protein [Agrobacterium salinitolerans]